jgi:DNA-binding transcriptional MerR regulator
MLTSMAKSEWTMDQLVKTANHRIAELGIKPSHHKARSKLTPRTVRYYLKIGGIPEADRVSGQIRFSEKHLQAIIRVKNLQAKGHFLKDITHDHRTKRDTVEQIVGFKAITFAGTKNNQSERWALKVGKDLTLSGSGTTPSYEELAVLKPFIQIWQQNSSLKRSKR